MFLWWPWPAGWEIEMDELKKAEDAILDTATLELTKAVADMLRYLHKRGVETVYAGGEFVPDQVFVSADFFDRNFPGEVGRVRYNGMEITAHRQDCASK